MRYFPLALVLSMFLVSCDATDPSAVSNESVTFSNEVTGADDFTLAKDNTCPCWQTPEEVAAELEGHPGICVKAGVQTQHEPMGAFYASFGCSLEEGGFYQAASVRWGPESPFCDGVSGVDMDVTSVEMARDCAALLRVGAREWNKAN